jgi:hypothetical protein
MLIERDPLHRRADVDRRPSRLVPSHDPSMPNSGTRPYAGC